MNKTSKKKIRKVIKIIGETVFWILILPLMIPMTVTLLLDKLFPMPEDGDPLSIYRL